MPHKKLSHSEVVLAKNIYQLNWLEITLKYHDWKMNAIENEDDHKIRQNEDNLYIVWILHQQWIGKWSWSLILIRLKNN